MFRCYRFFPHLSYNFSSYFNSNTAYVLDSVCLNGQHTSYTCFILSKHLFFNVSMRFIILNFFCLFSNLSSSLCSRSTFIVSEGKHGFSPYSSSEAYLSDYSQFWKNAKQAFVFCSMSVSKLYKYDKNVMRTRVSLHQNPSSPFS